MVTTFVRSAVFGALAWLALCGSVVVPALADAYDDGVAAYERGDYAAAMDLLLPAAQAGDARSQYVVGVMYSSGRGVAQGSTEAVKWYRLAAEQGYADAQYNIGSAYLSGRGVTKDPGEAAKWFRLAADQGDAYAQYNLGRIYADGNGVGQDWTEAAKWYRLAAEQGDDFAQNSLGVRYRDGTGAAQDRLRAQMWFVLAAAQGNEVAAKNKDENGAVLTPVQRAQAEGMAAKCKAANYKNCD